MNGPLFVSVDGFDGAGKSTLVAGLSRDLSRRGVTVAVIDRTLPQSTPQIDALAKKCDEISQDVERSVRMWEAAQQDG